MGKIIIINHYGVTPDLPGATKHYEIAKYFANHNQYEIEFWLCGFSHYTGKNHKQWEGFKFQSKEETDGFTTVRIKSTPYRKSAIARQLNIMLFDFITFLKLLISKDIEAILLSNPPVTIFTLLGAKIRNIKLVADVEDLWPLFLIEMGMTNKLAIKYMEFANEMLFNHSDRIVAVSDGMVDYVKIKLKINQKSI